MSLAREKKIEPFGEKPTADDYRREIALRVSLNDIVEFAQRRGVPIRDIVAQIRTVEQERKLDKQITNMGPAALANNFNEIVQAIREFEPLEVEGYPGSRKALGLAGIYEVEQVLLVLRHDVRAIPNQFQVTRVPAENPGEQRLLVFLACHTYSAPWERI